MRPAARFLPGFKPRPARLQWHASSCPSAPVGSVAGRYTAGRCASVFTTRSARAFAASGPSAAGDNKRPPPVTTDGAASRWRRAAGAAKPAPASAGKPPATAVGDPSPASLSPTSGLTCGGFFFTLDPNIGLWNDTTNPTWRLTFTDLDSKKKVRVPYAMATKHQGPHFEIALRLQFGYVRAEGFVAEVPESLTVDSGWEVAFPASVFVPVRVSQSKITLGGVGATVSCVDLPVGFCLGFQRVVSGHGVKGVRTSSAWRSHVAMMFGGVFAIGCAFAVATMPFTWWAVWLSLTAENEEQAKAANALWRKLGVDWSEE